MFRLIEKIHEKPKLPTETFRRDFSPYCMQLQPNTKAKSFERFKRKLVEKILANERLCIEDEEIGGESYEKTYGEEKWFPFSLFHLGEEKFQEEIERLYCTPLLGQWVDYYIDLGPYYIDSTPHYAHVRFEKVPSVAELVYAHCKVWQNFYREKGKDIKHIDHYYDGIRMRGNNSTLILEPFMSS